MRNNSCAVRAAFLSALFSTLASAQNNVLEAPPEPQMNRFAVSYRLGLNITADFKKLGGFTAVNQGGVGPGPATGGHTDRTYDDGYNKIDIRDNALGLTWNWGYENASQVPDPGNNVILFHSSSAKANVSSKNVGDDPQHGFEFIYNRRIRDAGKGWWGIEAAFGYTDVSIGDGRALRGNVSVLTDTYDLGGVFPPSPPPYHGANPNPPPNDNPLISDSPSRSFQNVPGGAKITGTRSIDAGVATFRVGPYFELPASTNLSFQFSGGFAMAAIDSEFRFRETVAISGLGSQTHSGRSHDGGVVPGGYVQGTVIWKLNKELDIFASAQYQALASYSQTAAGKRAELNMGESIFVSVGLGFSFK